MEYLFLAGLIVAIVIVIKPMMPKRKWGERR